jgi:hypothetical protein
MNNLPSGIYANRVETGEFRSMNKLVIFSKLF